jgi:hypothetical protein
MRTAEVEMSDAQFGNRLKGRQSICPSTFTYLFLLPGMRFRIALDIDDEAAAFATRFNGILVDAADRCRPHAERRGVAGPSALCMIDMEPAPQ